MTPMQHYGAEVASAGTPTSAADEAPRLAMTKEPLESEDFVYHKHFEYEVSLLDARGAPARNALAAPVPLRVVLLYDDGEWVAQQGILEVDAKTPPVLDTAGTVRFRVRINEISRVHGRRRFVIMATPEDPRDAATLGRAVSAPVFVVSKRSKRAKLASARASAALQRSREAPATGLRRAPAAADEFDTEDARRAVLGQRASAAAAAVAASNVPAPVVRQRSPARSRSPPLQRPIALKYEDSASAATSAAPSPYAIGAPPAGFGLDDLDLFHLPAAPLSFDVAMTRPATAAGAGAGVFDDAQSSADSSSLSVTDDEFAMQPFEPAAAAAAAAQAAQQMQQVTDVHVLSLLASISALAESQRQLFVAQLASLLTRDDMRVLMAAYFAAPQLPRASHAILAAGHGPALA